MANLQRTVLTHTTKACTATTVEVLDSNIARNYLLIQNIGASDVFIKFGADAVDNEGILIASEGGFYEAGQGGAPIDIREFDAICASGESSTLTIAEGSYA